MNNNIKIEDGEYEIIRKAIHTNIFKTKFNFGDEVYLIKSKQVEVNCSVCNGDCTIEHPIDKINIKCPYCHGSGKLTVDNTQMWYVVDDSFKVGEMRIKACSQDNYSVKYSVRNTIGSKYNPAEINMFATKELAQIECNKRNRPTKRIDLKDIVITSVFANTIPNSDKIKSCYDNYKNTGNLGKDIIVDKSNVLKDGYVGYLVYKMFGKENVKVVIDN